MRFSGRYGGLGLDDLEFTDSKEKQRKRLKEKVIQTSFQSKEKRERHFKQQRPHQHLHQVQEEQPPRTDYKYTRNLVNRLQPINWRVGAEMQRRIKSDEKAEGAEEKLRQRESSSNVAIIPHR